MFLPLLWNAIVVLPLFFYFFILTFIFHKSLRLSLWSLRICPYFDRWLRVKSNLLVNSKGQNHKVKKIRAKSQEHKCPKPKWQINAISECHASANSLAKVRWKNKMQKTSAKHSWTLNTLITITRWPWLGCWRKRNGTNTKMTCSSWRGLLVFVFFLQKIATGALLSSMFSLNWKIQHTEYWYTKTTNILYLDIWPTRKNWILLFCYTLIFLQRFLYIDLT